MAQVYISSVIDASAEQIWPTIRDFNGLPGWHPIITESRIESGAAADQVGCVRALRMHDGGCIREQLLALSDYEYSCTYAIMESPMEVENYIATLELTPVTDGGRTFAEWSAQFDCARGLEARLIAQIGDDVFQAGFDALKRRFGG